MTRQILPASDLLRLVQSLYPGAPTNVTTLSSGRAMVDLYVQGGHYVIESSPEEGYAISSVSSSAESWLGGSDLRATNEQELLQLLSDFISREHSTSIVSDVWDSSYDANRIAVLTELKVSGALDNGASHWQAAGSLYIGPEARAQLALVPALTGRAAPETGSARYNFYGIAENGATLACIGFLLERFRRTIGSDQQPDVRLGLSYGTVNLGRVPEQLAAITQIAFHLVNVEFIGTSGSETVIGESRTWTADTLQFTFLDAQWQLVQASNYKERIRALQNKAVRKCMTAHLRCTTAGRTIAELQKHAEILSWSLSLAIGTRAAIIGYTALSNEQEPLYSQYVDTPSFEFSSSFKPIPDIGLAAFVQSLNAKLLLDRLPEFARVVDTLAISLRPLPLEVRLFTVIMALEQMCSLVLNSTDQSRGLKPHSLALHQRLFLAFQTLGLPAPKQGHIQAVQITRNNLVNGEGTNVSPGELLHIYNLILSMAVRITLRWTGYQGEYLDPEIGAITDRH